MDLLSPVSYILLCEMSYFYGDIVRVYSYTVHWAITGLQSSCTSQMKILPLLMLLLFLFFRKQYTNYGEVNDFHKVESMRGTYLASRMNSGKYAIHSCVLVYL